MTSSQRTNSEHPTEIAAASRELFSDSASLMGNIKFAARKVRMVSEYYVEATVPGLAKHRIGPFTRRAQAWEWISLHSADWLSKNYGQQPIGVSD